MNRRQVIAALLALGAASTVYAQSMAKLPRIALVDPGEQPANMAEGRHNFWSAFLVELRRLGHAEGQSIIIDRWTGSGFASAEGYSELARKAVASQPRLIVARGPGRNVTGIHVSFDSQQLYGKQVEILSGVLKPGARIAWLGSQIAWESPVGEAARKGAASSKVILQPVFVANPINRPAIRRAFSEIGQARVDGLLISPVVELFQHRTSIAELAVVHRLPSLGVNRYWAEAGAVIGYGVDYDDMYRRAAGYVDKILKGADPAVMPIQLPTKVELVINLAPTG